MDAVQVSVAIPFAASSAFLVRHQFQDWLGALGSPPEVVEDARLVLTELVGNAVRHAKPLADGTMLVSWEQADHAVEIAVTDGGATTVPHIVDAGVSDLAGRGLMIVESIAAKWWAESTPSRSTVHARLQLA